MRHDLLSLIVPTRARLAGLHRLLDSLAATTESPASLEVILVVDEDDRPSHAVDESRLTLRRVVVPPGLSMGALNQAGYAASRGRYVMLLNDDVSAHTPGWDGEVRRCLAAFRDDIVLVHINDLVLQRHLCAFPIVSRTFCELTGGLCPTVYRRYRIDDHIEDHFNLLAALGERRIVYTPGVIFEHANYVTNDTGLRQYFADPVVLGEDAPRFEQLGPMRKRNVARLWEHIHGGRPIPVRLQRRLEHITDSFALRTPDRQRILTARGIVEPWVYEPRPTLWRRVARVWRERGARGVCRAMWRRIHSVTHRV